MKVRFGAAQLRLAFLPPMINPNQKKMNAHNEKDQQCRTSKKDGKLSATFSSINEAFAVVQKYLADNVFVCYYPPVSRKCNSVDLSKDSVCSSNLPAPFQASQYPNGGVLRDEYGSIRLSLDHANSWWWKREPCRSLCSGNSLTVYSVHKIR